MASKMKLVHDSVVKIEQQVIKQVEEVKKKVTQNVGEQMKERVTQHLTTIKDELSGKVDTVDGRNSLLMY